MGTQDNEFLFLLWSWLWSFRNKLLKKPPNCDKLEELDKEQQSLKQHEFTFWATFLQPLLLSLLKLLIFTVFRDSPLPLANNRPHPGVYVSSYFQKAVWVFLHPLQIDEQGRKSWGQQLNITFPHNDWDRLNYDLYCTFKDHGWWLSQGLEFHYVFQYSRNKSLIHSVHPWSRASDISGGHGAAKFR